MRAACSQLVQIDDEEGGLHWYLDGKRHREDGPAILRPNGSLYWYKNGVRHREDGPAIEYAAGDCWWYIDGVLHREDGPAIERLDGTGSWWLRGVEYAYENFDAALDRFTRVMERERRRGGSVRMLV